MSSSTSVMTRKGQVTIPVEIRRLWNIKEGDRVDFIRDGDQVRIEPVGDVVARTAGMMGRYRRGPAPTIKELKDAAEQAIAEDVVKRMSR
jgi:AbrB family looped-hinge helix DNA binding protein